MEPAGYSTEQFLASTMKVVEIFDVFFLGPLELGPGPDSEAAAASKIEGRHVLMLISVLVQRMQNEEQDYD